MTVDLDISLNANQQHAVNWGEGPLLVLAGPGSGKTAVLTHHIARLIENSPDDSFRILGLTFTVKAADEMRERIREITGEESLRIKLCTFHSFCTDLLRQHGSHIRLSPDFSIITDDKDRVAILGEMFNCDTLKFDAPKDFLKKINTMFMHGITPDDLPNYYKAGYENNCRKLQKVFRGYLDTLIENNQLDFGSMLYFTRDLLMSVPLIIKQTRTVYQHVCIDEFQDTNLAQYKILRLLAPGKTANLFVVADDDQMIFQWNGANPKRLVSLKQDYEPQIIKLPENYRCPARVVKIANRLIAHNHDRAREMDEGVSLNPLEGEVKLGKFDDFDSEIEGLISEISLIDTMQHGTCLVIARSNRLLVNAKKEMVEAGIEAEIIGRRQEFASSPVQLIYYALKVANSPDSQSMLDKLCSAASQLNNITVSAEEIYASAQVNNISPLRAFFSFLKTSDTLHSFATHGEELLCDSLDYQKFVKESFCIFDQLNKTDEEAENFSDYTADKENWETLDRKIFRVGGKISLHVFLQEIDLSPKTPEPSRNCVRLQTVHTAKGVEYENVYVIGLAEGQFPTYYAISKKDDSAIQEERRNCFVAITRASKNLYLSYSRNYFRWDKEPSRFLREMGLLDE